MSIHWLCDPALSGRLLDDSTFVKHSRRLSQRIEHRRSRDCGGSTSQPRADSVLRAPVTQSLNADSSLAPISRYLEKGWCHTWELNAEISTLSRTDLSALVGSEFQPNLCISPGFMMLHKTKKMVRLITCEVTFGQHVSKLVLGVNIFDLDFGVEIVDSVKQPIQRNSVGSGHVSHRRTSALYDHFDHIVIVFKNEQLSLQLKRTCICDNVIHIWQFINVSVTASFQLGLGICARDFSVTLASQCLMCVL